jgi:UDP-GlcNAc:undecaprenyl-phosphate/decaprenyl-phosphate GlcNAc-1-phosphate transferase
MTVTLGFVAGVVGALVAWRLMRPVFASAFLARLNYRGHTLPTAGGLVVVLVALGGEAAISVLLRAGLDIDPGNTGPRWTALGVALGFGLLGLLDDLVGDASARGYTGHLTALVKGELTTGGLKLFGGAAVALVVAGWVDHPGVGWLLVDAALIATAANLGNLLDRAPGRTVKVSTLGFVLLVLIGRLPAELVGVALVCGAGVGMLRADLAEDEMLGDTGANVLGGAVGLGVVLVAPDWVRLVVLVVVLGLNLASERVSFSAVIDQTPALRAIDRLGRRPAEPADGPRPPEPPADDPGRALGGDGAVE